MTTLTVEVASRTHQGLVRKRNEDSYYQGQWLYAVADGLGGHVAGDVASRTAIEAIKKHDRLVRPQHAADMLGQAVNDANVALRRKVSAQPELAGMGTTMVALLRAGDRAVIANIGDSRAYLLRRRGSRSNSMVQITEDHTYQHLVAHARQVPNLPARLTRFLDGRQDGRSPDLTALQLRPGDRLLLCSDGLSSYVPHESIQAVLSSDRSPGEAAEHLVTLALDEGGHDNITLIVIDVA